MPKLHVCETTTLQWTTQNFSEFWTWEDVKAAFEHTILSRVAALIKERDDGTYKVRIIIDMLRSLVNSFVKPSERIVLPRLMDVVTDIIDLANVCLASKQPDELDQMPLDFVDAFHTLGIHPEEWPYQIIKLPGQAYGCYKSVVFGGGGA